MPATTVARRAVLKELGKSNRGIEPKGTVSFAYGGVIVKWAMDENLTEGLTKDTARIEGRDILEVLQSTPGLNVGFVDLEGTYSMVDKFGNASEDAVIRARYEKDTLGRFNFENFDWKKIYVLGVADDVYVHPAFQY